MDIALHIIHALSALALIVLILLQQGKGAEAGASFGAGASQTMFGSSSSSNFLTRGTAALAVIFMVTSLALAWQAKHAVNVDASTQLLNQAAAEQQQLDKTKPTDVKSAVDSSDAVPSLGTQSDAVKKPAPESKPVTDIPSLGSESK